MAKSINNNLMPHIIIVETPVTINTKIKNTLNLTTTLQQIFLQSAYQNIYIETYHHSPVLCKVG